MSRVAQPKPIPTTAVSASASGPRPVEAPVLRSGVRATAVVLASTSPRRATLVALLGLPVRVLDPGVDDARERDLLADARARGLGPEACVQRLALAKLLSALARLRAADDPLPPGACVLAADTVVVDRGLLLGKAADRPAAEATLRQLAGRAHRILTGVALRGADGQLRAGVAETQVRLRAFSDDDLARYLDAEVWAGKAGAYGEQDPEAAPLIEAVAGSVSNVRGLPLELVARLLEEEA